MRIGFSQACHRANRSVWKQIDGGFQVLSHQGWPLGKIRLLPRPVFPGLDENAHEASVHRSADVGFRIVANHHDILGGAVETFDGKCEECPRRLAEHSCLSAGSVFQCRNERARVEAHFAVVIEKAAILRQGEKSGPAKKPAICLVQQIVSEELARIPDDNRFVTVCRQSREIFTQVGMHDEKRPQVPTPEKLLRYSGWRIDVFHRHLKSELREVTDNAAERAARRVGDELEGEFRSPDPSNRVERAGQDCATDIHDAVEVEQYTSDGTISSNR